MTPRTRSAQHPVRPGYDQGRLYSLQDADPCEPWGYFDAAIPGVGDPRLQITAWTHHGTAWISVVGALNMSTTAALTAMLLRTRAGASLGTVLNVSGLTDLDTVGASCITAQHHLSTENGRRFDIVAAWSPGVRNDEVQTPGFDRQPEHFIDR